MEAMRTNKGAVFYGAKDIRVEDVGFQPVKEQDVMVAVDTVGICGTDLHIYLDGIIPALGGAVQPWVIGHEGSGRIVEVGSGVKHLKVGDRVVLDPNAYCHNCDKCLHGKDNICSNANNYCWYPNRGFFEQFHVHPAEYANKIPESMAADEAAVVEPVACALHAIHRAGTKYGQSILICGAGPIGLLHLLVAKVYGVINIVITDINEERLLVAKQLGATRTILIDPKQSAETTGDEIHGSVKDGLDIVFECSGVEYSVILGIHAVKTGGKLALVGLSSTGTAKIPVNLVTVKEIDIIPSICYKTLCFREAIRLVENRAVDVRPLISHKFKLMDVQKAFQTLVDRSDPAVKILIDFSEK